MASLGHGLLAITIAGACAGPGEIRMGTGFWGGDSVLKIDFFALSVFFFCGFGVRTRGVLCCFVLRGWNMDTDAGAVSLSSVTPPGVHETTSQRLRTPARDGT